MAAGTGAWGPYQRGERWIVKLRTVPGGPGTSQSFATERAALAFQQDRSAAIKQTQGTQDRTIGDAVDAYERHLATEDHKQRTETLRRIRSFFEGELDLELRALTSHRCGQIYSAVAKRKATRWVGSGKKRKLTKLDTPVAADTHRGMLTHAKTFLSWCTARKWLRANPLASVRPIGRLKHGKPQLRIDEARRWYTAGLALAKKEPGALAALCALLLGLRATEITTREVRDLDDEGRLLWIPESKTAAGRRTLEVPTALRAPLRALARGRAGEQLLFGGYTIERGPRKGETAPHLRGWILFWTKKIAAGAGVPRVSAHSMRGLHATLAMQAGATSHLVAGALGHASDAVTLGSYVTPGAGSAVRSRAALGVLEGGKKRRR